VESMYENLGHHGANVLNEVKQEMQIIKVKLQHGTSRQEHVVI